jgi:UDP-N-acetylglucosamine 2-epimerase (non-hydrolysing)
MRTTPLRRSCPIIFPVHPRTQKKIADFGLESFFGSTGEASGRNGCHSSCDTAGIHLVAPLGYLDFLCLMKHARLVVTDSGGIQEETTALGVPCVTVRENTERPVTVDVGTNILAGTKRDPIRQAIQQQLALRGTRQILEIQIPEKWDGHAAARIVQILADKLMPDAPIVTAPETAAAPLQKNA